MLKKLFIGLAILCAAVGLAACGSSGSTGTSEESNGGSSGGTEGSASGGESAEDALIQVINPLPNVFVDANNKGAETAAQELGLKNLQITQSAGDAAKEIANVNDAVTKGAKAIIINPVSSEGVTPAIEAANEAGVCTIIAYSELANASSPNAVPPGSKAFIGWDEEEGGERVGRALAEAMGGKGGVVIIQGLGTDAAGQLREGGARKVWEKEFPEIKVLSAQPADFDPEKAQTVMQNFIQSYGDEIGGVLALGDQMGSAAATVIEESDLAGKVKVGGFGAEHEFVEHIANGSATATVPFAPIEDYERAVKLAAECIEGNKEPVRASSRDLPGVKVLKQDGYIVTDEDVKQWKPQW